MPEREDKATHHQRASPLPQISRRRGRRGEELAKFDMIIQSWDTANKSTELSDFSVCTTDRRILPGVGWATLSRRRGRGTLCPTQVGSECGLRSCRLVTGVFLEWVDQTVRHIHDETYLATGGNPGALQRFLVAVQKRASRKSLLGRHSTAPHFAPSRL